MVLYSCSYLPNGAAACMFYLLLPYLLHTVYCAATVLLSPSSASASSCTVDIMYHIPNIPKTQHINIYTSTQQLCMCLNLTKPQWSHIIKWIPVICNNFGRHRHVILLDGGVTSENVSWCRCEAYRQMMYRCITFNLMDSTLKSGQAYSIS